MVFVNIDEEIIFEMLMRGIRSAKHAIKASDPDERQAYLKFSNAAYQRALHLLFQSPSSADKPIIRAKLTYLESLMKLIEIHDELRVLPQPVLS